MVSGPGSIAEQAVAPSEPGKPLGSPSRDLFQGRPNLLGFPDFQPKPLKLQLSVL